MRARVALLATCGLVCAGGAGTAGARCLLSNVRMNVRLLV
jgi:hypothetical protein